MPDLQIRILTVFPVLSDETLDDLQRCGDVHAAPSQVLHIEVIVV